MNPNTESKRYAIVIGTNQYADSSLAELQSPTQDAMNLTRVLQDPLIGNYDVRLFLNASSYDVNKAVEGFAKNRRPDDVLLFFFSGHGLKDDEGRFYFATGDTQLDLLRSTAVSALFVNEALNSSRSRNQVVLLDSCFSGAFAKGMAGGNGRVLITATDALQYAWEGEKEIGGLGVFTNAVVKGLESGYADINMDGKISASELYNYVYAQLSEKRKNQTPRMWAFGLDGDIIVAENRRKS